MKKLAAIWILFLYVGLNTIDVINIHYCHGAFESVNLSGPDQDCCEHEHEGHTDHSEHNLADQLNCCEHESEEPIACSIDKHKNHSDCCEDFTVKIDFDSEHLVQENLLVKSVFVQSEIILPDSQISEITSSDINPEKPDPGDKSPPEPIYQLTSAFLFYG